MDLQTVEGSRELQGRYGLEIGLHSESFNCSSQDMWFHAHRTLPFRAGVQRAATGLQGEQVSDASRAQSLGRRNLLLAQSFLVKLTGQSSNFYQTVKAGFSHASLTVLVDVNRDQQQIQTTGICFCSVLSHTIGR